MAIRDILQIPHPILRQRAKKVRRIDKRILRLAYDMVETLQDADGAGLAANQVGELRRLIVIQIPEEEEARIYFNPEIKRRRGIREVEEACLSHPGYKATIERSVWVRFGALDHTVKEVEIDAEDLLAQAMEHEVDHLNGILYIDHLKDHSKLYRVDEDGERIDGDDDFAVQDVSRPDTPPMNENTPASMKIR